MIKKYERYVIVKRRKSPEQALQYLADDRYAFYDATDLTTEEDDAYKYKTESLAREMLIKYGLDPEDYEVKQLNETYEVIQ